MANPIPEPWYCGQPWRHPVPHPNEGKHWEECHDLVLNHDEKTFRANKGAIDNLLIFAGLFSATVTSFTVESYKWLDDQNGHPSPAELKINVFWFLSLTLSMTTVLIGIVCMQWMREYRRDAPRSHKDALAMRQMRYEGLVAWKIPVILTLLPLLLLSAFVLFFAGVLQLLWSKNSEVAAVITFAVGLASLFLVMTTILPAIQSLSARNKDLQNVKQCPYKSPQSWAFYRLCLWLIHLFRPTVHFINQIRRPSRDVIGLVWRCISRHTSERQAKCEPPQFEELSHRNWIDHDVRWRLLRDTQYLTDKDSEEMPTVDSEQPFALQDGVDIVRSLQWVGRTFSEDISTIHFVFHCLTDLNCSVAAQVVGGPDDGAAYLPGLLFPTILPRSPRSDIPPSHPMHLRPDAQAQEHIFAAFLAVHKQNHPTLNDSYLECAIRLMNEAGQYIPHLSIRPTDSGDVFQVISFETVLQLFLCLKKLVARGAFPTDNTPEIWALLADLYRRDPDVRDPLLTLTFDFFECFHMWLLSPTILDVERMERVKVCTRGIILLFGSMSVDEVFALRRTESFVKLEWFALELDKIHRMLQPTESRVLDGLRVRRWPHVMRKIFSTSISGPPTGDSANLQDHAE